MNQSPQPATPAFSRRSMLTALAGGSAAALLTGCQSSAAGSSSSPQQAAAAAETPTTTGPGSATTPIPDASSSLRIDFSTTAFFPLLKSKIGIGRALDSAQLLDTLPYMDQIRPALYDAEIRFADTDFDSLKPYPFQVASDGTISVLPNDFLNSFFAGLHQRGIEIVVQLEEGPKQWWNYAGANRPHLMPLPTNLPDAARAIGMWTKQYSQYPINWCVWNEPTHTITGSPDPQSITQLIEIYHQYTGAVVQQARTTQSVAATRALFGMASFIDTSTRVRADLGNKSYFQAALGQLQALQKTNPGVPFDYLTLNNYGENLTSLFDGARDGLGTGYNTVPIIQAQSGVFLPGTWEKSGGTALEAAKSMTSLQTALKVPDLQTFTFSGWMPHMITFKGNTALLSPLFNALRLYARMPDRSTPVQGALPAGLGVMASGDQYRGCVMVWNETIQAHNVELQLSQVAAAKQSGAQLTVYTIDSEHGSPMEHSGNDFTPTESGPLGSSSQSLTKTVTVAGPGIVYVEIGAAKDPDLDRGGLSATFVRKHTYADRITDKNGKTSVRGNAYGCYDSLRAIAYVGVEGNQGTAVVGAEYLDLPDTLPVAIWTDRLAAKPASQEALLGIRVDYIVGGNPAGSVLWHGDIFDGARTTALPWGVRGATAQTLLPAPELDAKAGAGTLELPLARYAPTGWIAGKQAIISFWMDSAGPGSQARFLLG